MPAMLHRLVMGPNSRPAWAMAEATAVLVGDVTADGDGLAPAEAASALISAATADGVLGHIEAGHRRTLGGQPAGGGPSDARTGTGHHGHPAA